MEKNATTNISTSAGTEANSNKENLDQLSTSIPPTIEISLTSWTLANGTHPVLCCTVESAQTWKDRKDDGKGLLSTTLSLTKKMLGPFLSTASTKKKEEAPPKEEQYFKDAAAVSTPYGDGIITGFRPEDGFYSVLLQKWTLSNGRHPTAYLKKNDIRCRIVKGCQEGYPVFTKFGLTGTLASVEPTTGK
jgi:hypothetical protein